MQKFEICRKNAQKSLLFSGHTRLTLNKDVGSSGGGSCCKNMLNTLKIKLTENKLFLFYFLSNLFLMLSLESLDMFFFIQSPLSLLNYRRIADVYYNENKYGDLIKIICSSIKTSNIEALSIYSNFITVNHLLKVLENQPEWSSKSE